MKASSVFFSLATAAIASAQSCEPSEPYYNITTMPFFLVVASEDGGVNSTVSTCHVGAALESLCLSNVPSGSSDGNLSGATFHFNTSQFITAPSLKMAPPGILTWWLQTSNLNVPSSMAFNYDVTSNLALPIISPGSSSPQQIAFDQKNHMVIQANTPGKDGAQGTLEEYDRWYACNTTYASYQYFNLAWGLGKDDPDNESCVKVSVTRIFDYSKPPSQY